MNHLPAEGAEFEYKRRISRLSLLGSQVRSRERLVGYARLAIAAFSVLWILFRMRHFSRVDLLVLVPVAVFVALAIVHERFLRRATAYARAIQFYEQGLARLNGGWPGRGVSGDRFLPATHPCARDLDLFGRGSVFELLCTARTRAGEEALAQWLLEPAPPATVRARQAAAVELSERLDFRESLALMGETVGLGVNPEALLAWGEASASLPMGGVMLTLRIIAPILAVLWIASVIAWQVWSASELLVLVSTVVNLSVTYRFRMHLSEAAHAIEGAGHDLNLLSQVLHAFETEPFQSPRLLQLQKNLRSSGIASSRAIAKLNRIVEFLESAHNLFVRVFDFVIFYRLQFVLAAESWRRHFGPSLRTWLEAIGELEAIAALGGYTYEHPADVFPEFVEQGTCFQAEGLTHPLIPQERAIRNDLSLGPDLQLLLISGPNMAGKSTFLRGIGVNAVLAQCGAPVRASKLRLSPLMVTASICVLDSLEGGISRFYAEINRLKQIMDLTKGSIPVLYLFDELLSGTNSFDRLIGTRSIVTGLVARGAIGLVTTHDLALTSIPDEIGPHAVNGHFEDHLENGELRFDYKLYPGVVQTSNALPLMRSIGLDV